MAQEAVHTSTRDQRKKQDHAVSQSKQSGAKWLRRRKFQAGLAVLVSSLQRGHDAAVQVQGTVSPLLMQLAHHPWNLFALELLHSAESSSIAVSEASCCYW